MDTFLCQCSLTVVPGSGTGEGLMRILMIQPNYHAGGAEIAGNWPPGWVAYIGGALKRHGFTNLRFVDAMTNHIDDQRLEEFIRHNAPDVVMATAITPMIYQAQRTLEIARKAAPDCVTILGGIHPTFMYAQVFGEAPWIDYIVRGEGEEIIVELLRAIADGRAGRERAQHPGHRLPRRTARSSRRRRARSSRTSTR